MTNECNSNGEEKLDENFKSIPNFEILVIIHDDFNNAEHDRVVAIKSEREEEIYLGP